jgi:hypothetical protein
MPARLPPERVDPPARYLRDLAIGERAAVRFTAMRVDAEGFCYLDPSADIVENELAGLTITVARNAAGYHVTAERTPQLPQFKFMRMPGFWSRLFRKYVPVETFTEKDSPTGILTQFAKSR